MLVSGGAGSGVGLAGAGTCRGFRFLHERAGRARSRKSSFLCFRCSSLARVRTIAWEMVFLLLAKSFRRRSVYSRRSMSSRRRSRCEWWYFFSVCIRRDDILRRMLFHAVQTWRPGPTFSIVGAVLMVSPLGVRPLRRHEFRKLRCELWMASFLCDLYRSL